MSRFIGSPNKRGSGYDFVGESRGPMIDNLDKAEKFGWVDSADQWMLYRQLRNRMIHEYIEKIELLAESINLGRSYVPTLIQISERITRDAQRRL